MKFLKEDFNKIEEKLPKDLARAYRNDEYKKRNMDGKYETTDYEKAEYTEITPEEAIAYKRRGQINNLRIIVDTPYNGKLWVQYYSDGTCATSKELSVSDRYVTKTGKKITNVKYMPFAHVVKIAKKIYYTDENKVQISPEKLKRRDFDNSHYHYIDPDNIYAGHYGDSIFALGNDRHSGKHKERHYYYDDKYYRKKAMEYKKDIKDLQTEFDNGDISKNDYESRLELYTGWYNDAMKDYYSSLQGHRNARARDKFADDATRMQSNLNKFKALKAHIKRDKDDLKSYQNTLADMQANGEKASKYSYTIERIDQLKQKISDLRSQIYYAQRALDACEKELTDDAQAADIQNYLNKIEDKTAKITNLQNELNKLLKRDSQ